MVCQLWKPRVHTKKLIPNNWHWGRMKYGNKNIQNVNFCFIDGWQWTRFLSSSHPIKSIEEIMQPKLDSLVVNLGEICNSKKLSPLWQGKMCRFLIFDVEYYLDVSKHFQSAWVKSWSSLFLLEWYEKCGPNLNSPISCKDSWTNFKLMLLTIHLLQALLIFTLRARAFSWRWILL